MKHEMNDADWARAGLVLTFGVPLIGIVVLTLVFAFA